MNKILKVFTIFSFTLLIMLSTVLSCNAEGKLYIDMPNSNDSRGALMDSYLKKNLGIDYKEQIELMKATEDEEKVKSNQEALVLAIKNIDTRGKWVFVEAILMILFSFLLSLLLFGNGLLVIGGRIIPSSVVAGLLFILLILIVMYCCFNPVVELDKSKEYVIYCINKLHY